MPKKKKRKPKSKKTIPLNVKALGNDISAYPFVEIEWCDVEGDAGWSNIKSLNSQLKKSLPIFIKLSPDLSLNNINEILNVVENCQVTGIIATNTSTARENLNDEYKSISGGLSGRPLFQKSNKVLEQLVKEKKISEKMNILLILINFCFIKPIIIHFIKLVFNFGILINNIILFNWIFI